MLEFAHLWAFALLPAPLLVAWLLPAHRERTGSLRVPFFESLVDASGAEARAGATVLRRQWLQVFLTGLCWVALVAGLAKPEWVGEPIVRTEASRDVMLAIDLSGSMDYADFPGETGDLVRRFDAVQRVVDAFVAARDGDRIGLIVFGDRAYLQLPFTQDLRTASELVALMDVGMAGPRTALGDAIGLAIRAFESSEVDERLLIVLTDGNDTASKMKPVNAADIATLNGLEVYTIGVGDPEATGEDRVDFGVLTEIAERTGGRFFSAEDETTLASVYARIDELTVGEVKTTSWRPRDSLVHWPAGFAAGIAVVGYTLLLLLGRRSGRS